MSEKDAPQSSTAYTRTLRLAAETLGGVGALARSLSADPAAVERWIAGTEFPPHQVFLQALDIVASGPLAAQKAADRAQAAADRLQGSANRARDAADRAQRSADRAQDSADRAQRRADDNRQQAERGDSGRFRRVQQKDGPPASNKPGESDEKKTG